METALEAFVSTIDNTGGVLDFGNGTYAPVEDEDWIDLGIAYMQACAELKRKPKRLICRNRMRPRGRAGGYDEVTKLKGS